MFGAMNGVVIIVGLLLVAMLAKLLMDRDWVGLAVFLPVIFLVFFTGRGSK